MRYFYLILVGILIVSCSDAFINHKLQYEKLGPCSNEAITVKMISNIAGERYEFVSCLDDNFDGKNYQVERKGDSIMISFEKAKKAPSAAAFKLTLDIDAKPPYHHIILDGEDIPIVQQQ